MKIRLIPADVDGTLLNGRKELTDPVRDAIEAVKHCGILFTIATGRDISGLRQFEGLMSPGAPVITCNGAELRMAGSGELLSAVCLPKPAANEIIRLGLESGFSVIVWSRGVLYIGQAGQYSEGYSEMYGIRERELTDADTLAKQGVTKVIWAGESGRIGELEKSFSAAPVPGSECCTSDTNYLEFMAAGVNKGAGLRAAAEALGLDRSEVMAIGDGHNDLSMLYWAGRSVAMGNASREVKAAAGFVTGSCEENGLADALLQLLEAQGTEL